MPEESFEEDRRRVPAEYTPINEINSEDVRVSIIGTVVDREGETLIVDDGTGKSEVEFDLSEDLSEFESGDTVRIIGRPNEEILSGEVVQDFSDFDIELYRKAMSKLDKVRSQL